MSHIYFDHSATTPVDPQVLEAMLPYFSERFGNPSSVHSYGQQSALAIDQARQQVADFFACLPQEVIFTSGATESNNLALVGLVKALSSSSSQISDPTRDHETEIKPHIITTVIEHDAVLEPCQDLLNNNQAELTFLAVNNQAQIDLTDLKKNIKANTVLISIGYVNSEIGSIQAISAIGKLISKVNEERHRAWEAISSGQRPAQFQKLYFHSDATQAVNFLPCNIQDLKLDLLSVSAHKIYGPKGVGALIAREGTPLSPLVRGGHHERNLRSGTLNVPGIVGLAQALNLVKQNQYSNNQKISEVRNYLVDRIIEEISDLTLNTDLTNAVASHAHFSFHKTTGESILMALDMEANIAVSTGSACASNSGRDSKVLLALGRSSDQAQGAIRFSLGKNNTKAEVDKLMKHLPGIVAKFRI
jgi:cysteine desulfurase